MIAVMVSYKYTFLSYLFDGKVWSTGNITVVEPGVWKNLSVKWGSHGYGSEEDDCKTYLEDRNAKLVMYES